GHLLALALATLLPIAQAPAAFAAEAPPTFETKWGTSGSANGQFQFPQGISADASGNNYVADTYNHRIQKFTTSGVPLAGWGSEGADSLKFEYPQAVAVDRKLGVVYITDGGNNRVVKYSSTGAYITKWGALGAGNGQFSFPVGVAVDTSGNVYVADSNNHRIQKFTGAGA